MSKVSSAHPMVAGLCKALGIDPCLTTEIHLHIVQNEAVMIEVKQYADLEFQTLIEGRYHLMPIEEPNDG